MLKICVGLHSHKCIYIISVHVGGVYIFVCICWKSMWVCMNTRALICTPAFTYVYGFMCAHTGGTCLLVYIFTYIFTYIYTHLHALMCCHRSRLPCAPGLSDGDPYSGNPRVLWNRPLCYHIFSCCAQHLTRSKLSEDRFIFGLLFKETQSSLLQQSIEAGALVTGLMTSTV